MLTSSEENYLKAIYKLAYSKESKMVSTNELADYMNMSAPSITDMIKKLSVKGLVEYRPYQGVRLLENGNQTALKVIRKHRLWEVFLVNKLKFNWDEVHEVAEQLEHIHSEKLIDKLDEHLGFPDYDPHGDPIPKKDGTIKERSKILLAELKPKQEGVVILFSDTTDNFLRYLDKVGINIGSKLKVLDKTEFDGSLDIEIDGIKRITVSSQVSNNIYLEQ